MSDGTDVGAPFSSLLDPLDSSLPPFQQAARNTRIATTNKLRNFLIVFIPFSCEFYFLYCQETNPYEYG